MRANNYTGEFGIVMKAVEDSGGSDVGLNREVTKNL